MAGMRGRGGSPRMRAGTQERPVWDHTANGHGLTGTGGHSYRNPWGPCLSQASSP